jgi:NADPH2:quinone reductase
VHAVVIREFGPPEVLEPAEVPEPAPGPGEVVVDVELAGVTFVETQVRAGRPPHPAMLPALPAILGNGVGGTAAGRPVVTSLAGTGGYAERAVAAAEHLIDVPAGVSLRDAVALLADGRTAMALMAAALPRPGETVLVEAAAGGVGTLLVQLARNAGARVIALAGAAAKLAVARDLGADVAVSYAAAGWEQQVRDAAGGVDVVFDGVGGDIGLAAFGLLRAGGRFCPFGMASGGFAAVTPALAQAHQVSVRMSAIPDAARRTELARAALGEAAAGRLRAVIGQELDLDRAAAAHAAIEARATTGKTLLTVRRPGHTVRRPGQ